MSKPGPTLPFSVVPPPEPLASVVLGRGFGRRARLVVVSAATGDCQSPSRTSRINSVARERVTAPPLGRFHENLRPATAERFTGGRLGSPCDARPGESGGDRRRRRRLLDPLLAGAPRLGRRRPRRARRPDVRFDLPLGRARRPAAQLALADEDDDGERRALPHDRGGGRARDGLARGRLAASGVVGGAARGDRAAGRLGEDVRLAVGAGLARRGAGALPADVHRGCARRRVSARATATSIRRS